MAASSSSDGSAGSGLGFATPRGTHAMAEIMAARGCVTHPCCFPMSANLALYNMPNISHGPVDVVADPIRAHAEIGVLLHFQVVSSAAATRLPTLTSA